MKHTAPMRWTERPPGGKATVDRAAELFRKGDPAALLPRGAAERALAKAQAPRPRRFAQSPRALRYALAALVVVLAPVSFAAIAKLAPPLLRPLWEKVTRPSPRKASPAPAVPTPPEPEPAAVAPPPTPEPPEARAAEEDFGIDLTQPLPEELVTAAPPNVLAIETRLLARAVEHLRERGDGRACLAALDDYERKFPKGSLGAEARMVRLDALLALGRRAEALRLLERLGTRRVARLPRGAALLALKGELLREAGRCKEAITTFEAPLRAPDPELRERALFGRAACRAAVGEVSAARADLERYLRQFPDGRFADEVRAAQARLR